MGQDFAADSDPLTTTLNQNKCPDCGGSNFLDGPSGGMSQNIECANCGSDFNVTPSDGPPFLTVERIGWNRSGRHNESERVHTGTDS